MRNSSNLGASIRTGSAWLVAGSTGVQILNFLFGIVLARLLAPEEFGMLITISIYTGIAGFISGAGMGQALVRSKKVTKQDHNIVFTLQLLVGSLIYISFFFAAPWLAKWYDTPLYSDLLQVSALSFISRAFVNVPNSILYRDMRFKERSGVEVIVLVVSSSISIGMAYTGFGVWSLIVGGLLGSVIKALLFTKLAKWRPALSKDFQRGRDIASYGLMITVTDFLIYLRSQASVFVLSHALGPASVGIFNKGSSLARMPNSFITGSVYQVLFRALAIEQDNLDKCRYLFNRSIALVAVYTTPFYVGLLWLAEPLIRGIYGPKWVEAAVPLMILAFAWPFWLISTLSGAVLAAKNWLSREAFVQASNLIITCLAILIGIPYGIEGVAIATVCTACYTALYMYWLVLRCLRANWIGSIRSLFPAILLNSILASILFLSDHLTTQGLRSHDLLYAALMIIIGGLVYIACFLFLPIAALRTEQQRWKIKLRDAVKKQKTK